MRRKNMFLILIFLSVFHLNIKAGENQQSTLKIVYFENPPKIDGILDDAAWQKAAKIKEFTQFQPKAGLLMTEETRAYVGYDSDNLYIGFHAKDSSPSQVRAYLSPRDNAFDSDWVGIILDTFGDQRRAYEFFSNPLGVQMDMIATAGNGEDLSADFIWYSEGKLQKDGYSVEFKIPFKSLHFQKNAEQKWRLSVIRQIRRKNEKGMWPEFSANNGTLASQMADLKGVLNVHLKKKIDIVTEVAASRFVPTEKQQNASHIKPWNARAGLNFKYGITPSWTLNSTYNPDFSQIESDMPQTTNQRYLVYYPEKRLFFMEGADIFSMPLRLVQKRTIVDPEYGVKLTGRQGKYSAGFLFSNDKSGNESIFNISRITRNIGQESVIGVLYSEKVLGAGKYNRVGAVDGNFQFKKLYKVQFQMAESFSNKTNTGYASAPAYYVSLSRNSRNLWFSTSYTDLHPNFQADGGFLSRLDIRQSISYFRYTFWKEKGKLISWGPFVGYHRIYNHNEELTDDMAYFGLRFNFPLQTNINMTYTPGALELYQGINFRKRSISFDISSEPNSFFSTSLSVNSGEDINYSAATPYLGDSLQGKFSLILKPNSRLNIQQSYLKSRLTSKSGARIFDENIHRTKLTFQLDKEISGRLIYQYNTLGHDGFVSSLITYLLTPGTAFYLGYDMSFESKQSVLKKTRTILFTKFSYLFRL